MIQEQSKQITDLSQKYQLKEKMAEQKEAEITLQIQNYKARIEENNDQIKIQDEIIHGKIEQENKLDLEQQQQSLLRQDQENKINILQKINDDHVNKLELLKNSV